MNEETKRLLELKKEFHLVFSGRMAMIGFGKHRSGTYFEKTSYGKRGVTVFHNVRFGALSISASMSIKVDAVEQLLFEYRTKIRGDEDEHIPGEFTICEDLGNIKIGIFRHWNCYNQADMLETIIELEDLVLNHGLHFLAELDTPEKILNEMIASTQRKSKLGHPALIYEKALVLMYVLNRADLFKEYGPTFEEIARANEGTVIWERELFFKWISDKFAETVR